MPQRWRRLSQRRGASRPGTSPWDPTAARPRSRPAKNTNQLIFGPFKFKHQPLRRRPSRFQRRQRPPSASRASDPCCCSPTKTPCRCRFPQPGPSTANTEPETKTRFKMRHFGGHAFVSRLATAILIPRTCELIDSRASRTSNRYSASANLRLRPIAESI